MTSWTTFQTFFKLLFRRKPSQSSPLLISLVLSQLIVMTLWSVFLLEGNIAPLKHHVTSHSSVFDAIQSSFIPSLMFRHLLVCLCSFLFAFRYLHHKPLKQNKSSMKPRSLVSRKHLTHSRVLSFFCQRFHSSFTKMLPVKLLINCVLWVVNKCWAPLLHTWHFCPDKQLPQVFCREQ